MLNRRQLLERSALLSLAPLVPAFVRQTASAATPQRDERALVVIQLDGGNDGLNMVVPHRDEHYARLRPVLKLDPKKLIRLNDDLGLHETMKGAGQLFDGGQLSIVQGVGYPNPDRSHFRSMAIWQSARLDSAEHEQYGWLGRALDGASAPGAGPQAVFVGNGTTPGTLWSRRAAVATIESREAFALQTRGSDLQSALAAPAGDGALGQAVAQSTREALALAEQLQQLTLDNEAGDGAYPSDKIGQQLKLIAALLKSDCAARVYYAIQSGYDTHAGQSNDHSLLLNRLSRTLKAFVDDLAASGLGDRVLVLAFSEFGRRAGENDSAGTDHGAAGPVLLAGTNLASGLIGPNPNLAELVDGDVAVSIDFRQLYATVLDQWLGMPSAAILGGDFAPLPLFKTPA